MKGISRILIIISVSLLYQGVYAQDDQEKRPKEKVYLNGTPFYKHVAQDGESLYFISREYNVPQVDIVRANPDIYNGIKKGQVLYIPLTETAAPLPADTSKIRKHTVAKGETLQAISRKYRVSMADIVLINPDITAYPEVGTIVRIPNKTVDFIAETLFSDTTQFLYHKIEKGQTLYYLQKKYEVEEDEILKANPGIEDGLKVGQVVRIPIIGEDFGSISAAPDTLLDNPVQFLLDSLLVRPDASKYPCNGFTYSTETFRVALLMPFFIDENTKAGVFKDDVNSRQKKFFGSTKIILAFYEGVQMALDVLRREGLNIDLYVYDTGGKDELKVADILKNEDMKQMDLIIGPAYSSNFRPVADFAMANEISIISPLSSNNSVVAFNPFVYQATPSPKVIAEYASYYLAKQYDHSFLIVHNDTDDEKEMATLLRDKLANALTQYSDSPAFIYKEINYKQLGFQGFEDALSVGRKNVVIMASNDEVFVTDMVTKLDTLSDMYGVSLFSSNNWQKFTSVDLKKLYNLDYHYVATSYIDYSDDKVKDFVRRYRAVFKTEPSQYAFHGYDLMYYFANALKKYGKDFRWCLSPFDETPNRKGLRNEFVFTRRAPLSGFENRGLFILSYDPNFNMLKNSIPLQDDIFFKYKVEGN